MLYILLLMKDILLFLIHIINLIINLKYILAQPSKSKFKKFRCPSRNFLWSCECHQIFNLSYLFKMQSTQLIKYYYLQ